MPPSTVTKVIVRTPGPQGPPGAQGPPGSSGDSVPFYVHEQPSPLLEWVVQHNQGYYPAVTVVDSAGNIVVGDVDYINTDSLKILFSAPFAGRAYLS